MKKIMLMALAVAAILPSCTKDDDPEEEPKVGKIEIKINSDTIKTHKEITFGILGGQFEQQPMTRATLSSLSLTDLWLYDGETLLKHQTADDADFGAPSVDVDYGDHTFYFVASRGSEPTQTGTTISWNKPSDTFWASLSLTVAPSTSASQSVTLQRVAARLRVTITDEVPAALSSLCVTPSTWYYGIDYTKGEAADIRTTTRTISVPASYAGTTGQLAASFYCHSPLQAWTTDITLTAKASDNSTISQISIADVPMQRNHITAYSGTLFGAGRAITVEADDAWGEDITGSW